MKNLLQGGGLDRRLREECGGAPLGYMWTKVSDASKAGAWTQVIDKSSRRWATLRVTTWPIYQQLAEELGVENIWARMPEARE